ncbi:MAG TPA: formamidase, partial [Rhizomicrobium sp.]|nr:formamidase [Rhizomicrobium sp.]
MPETLIKVDLTKSAYDNDMVHNRWHPDIPIVAWVNPGDDFIIETYDWTGGFIKNNDSADDVRDIDLSIVHFLSGPIGVKGAEPGDLLVVDLLDVGPMKESLWGFNGFFSKQKGGGFLTDHFPLAQKSIWDIKGLYTSSRHIPGVNFAGLIHPGLIGCLPDPKMLDTWNKREAELIATNPTRVPGLANPPFAPTTHAGQAKGDVKAKIAAEGARTVPPREHGGNCDIKDLSRGSKIYFPVYVPGGGLSMGDLHFSQGDGEITFCGAIEMAGWLHLKVDVIKDGVAKYGITNPTRVPPLANPPFAATSHCGTAKGDVKNKIAAEGARTVPPREHGGNCDIKDLSRGSKIYFPVYVKGGGLSMGDLHFSQGDGEITFCGAIEMAGWLHIKVDVIKDGVAKYGIKNPVFKPSPITPNYKDYLIFEGISVDEQGKQHYLDVHIAYRQACLNAIEYLKKFGYSGAQAYSILGTAPCQGHISGVVDVPNACATLWLPTEIFDFDVMPSSAGPIKHIKGDIQMPLSQDK